MAQILQSLLKTVIAGVVLLIIILLVETSISGTSIPFSHAWGTFVMRWLHVASGVMWIGLLWYFNFVQIPSMPNIPDEQKPAISKVIAPTALFWFRYAALATVITGLLVAEAIDKTTCIGILWELCCHSFNLVLKYPNAKIAF